MRIPLTEIFRMTKDMLIAYFVVSFILMILISIRYFSNIEQKNFTSGVKLGLGILVIGLGIDALTGTPMFLNGAVHISDFKESFSIHPIMYYGFLTIFLIPAIVGVISGKFMVDRKVVKNVNEAMSAV